MSNHIKEISLVMVSPESKISRRNLFRGAALIGGAALGGELLSACGAKDIPAEPATTVEQTPTSTPTPTPSAAESTPSEPERWLPVKGDYLSPDKLAAMTPEELAVAGRIEAKDVKTLEDLGNELNYRFDAMDTAGVDINDAKPFIKPNGQTSVQDNEAFVTAMQQKYLVPLISSIGFYELEGGVLHPDAGIAQENRFVLMNYIIDRVGESMGVEPDSEPAVIRNKFIEGTVTEGNFNDNTFVCSMKFHQQCNESKTTIGIVREIPDTNQYETYEMRVTREGDHILIRPTGKPALVENI